MKHVQIPESLFIDLVFFHLLDNCDSGEKIKKELSAKMDSIIRHGHYSKYKTTLDENAREEARRKYLDSAGIANDFRW